MGKKTKLLCGDGWPRAERSYDIDVNEEGQGTAIKDIDM